MGLQHFSDTPDPRNPNPARFDIVRLAHVDGLTIALIHYPNCTNYEGRKILIFEAPAVEVCDVKWIDPHFCDGVNVVPLVARFQPTDEGWTDALLFCKAKADKKRFANLKPADVNPTEFVQTVVATLAVLPDDIRKWMMDEIEDHFCEECAKFHQDCEC